MENNEPPPPPSPPRTPQNTLLIYDYNPPYDIFENLFPIPIRCPFPVTLYNFNINNTHLYFTVTSRSITITPLRSTSNHNNVADDDDNNGPEDLDLMHVDDEGDNNNNNEGGEYHDLVPNGIVADNHVDGADDDNNLIELFDPDDDYNEEAFGFHIFHDMDGVREYGISLPTLPTLPAYINIGLDTFVLLVNSGPSVHVICPAPPLPINPYYDDGNNDLSVYHGMPFDLRFAFNDPITKTIINVVIRVSSTNLEIRASTQEGVSDYVAYLAMVAPEPRNQDQGL